MGILYHVHANILFRALASSPCKGSPSQRPDSLRGPLGRGPVRAREANNSNSTTTGAKFDCAKECPCGVPAIPVPDQWLEVMVTGGFKVWHIIFIIIAFIVTIVVVYCCFHRCRIPRTKQEIEADLMRTNLASKFRDYLQEFPNEPTTFLEALKKVQDLEEKSSEQEDAGARKRMGWLKLKGKERQEKSDGLKDDKNNKLETAATASASAAAAAAVAAVAASAKPGTGGDGGDKDDATAPGGPDKAKSVADKAAKMAGAELASVDQAEPPAGGGLKPLDFNSMKTSSERDKQQLKLPAAETTSAKADDVATTRPKLIAPTSKQERKAKGKEAKLIKTKGEKVLDDSELPGQTHGNRAEADKKAIQGKTTVVPSEGAASSSASANRPARARRRKDKPNLSRTKATTNAGSRGESIEIGHNQLTLPSVGHHHHHQHQHHHHEKQHHLPDKLGPGASETTRKEAAEVGEQSAVTDKTKKERKQAKAATKSTGRVVKTKGSHKESTVIQIEPNKLEDINP